LPRRAFRAADDRCDLVERNAERVVENERHPLGRLQLFEDDHQREPNRFRHYRLVFGGVRTAFNSGLGRPIVRRILAARLP
jgi:hypothetical protein